MVDHKYDYDVAIIGAGPAGTSCAIALKNSGLKIILIDKRQFPRDKICGDAIPGPAIKVLKQIAPESYNSFISGCKKNRIIKTSVYLNSSSKNPSLSPLKSIKNADEEDKKKDSRSTNSTKKIEFNWVNEAYTSKRFDFDQFLLDEVKKNGIVEIQENTELIDLKRIADGFELLTSSNVAAINCRILLGVDGVNGITSKKLAGNGPDKKHHVAAIRQYFTGISGLEDNTLHLFLDKKYPAAYLWIFPVGSGLWNTGFGMLSDKRKKENLDLKKTFEYLISASENIAPFFLQAEAVDKIQGMGIPLGSRWVKMSGERFMLAGDAASLADPIGGEGIANAMISGQNAASQIIKCFEQNDFSETFMAHYDAKLFELIGLKMKRLANVQNYLSDHPKLLHLIFNLGKYKWIRKMIL